ncbi:hypothetical protein GCM10009689_18420 [Brevibacterium antiquum]|uniref:hypothetical protein n=1 Tax=Brevibacterium antiquum TaxID=234835 RepID=UPI0018DF7491|nr:hypothetical protein [Brevibacterium antiquum]
MIARPIPPRYGADKFVTRVVNGYLKRIEHRPGLVAASVILSRAAIMVLSILCNVFLFVMATVVLALICWIITISLALGGSLIEGGDVKAVSSIALAVVMFSILVVGGSVLAYSTMKRLIESATTVNDPTSIVDEAVGPVGLIDFAREPYVRSRACNDAVATAIVVTHVLGAPVDNAIIGSDGRASVVYENQSKPEDRLFDALTTLMAPIAAAAIGSGELRALSSTMTLGPDRKVVTALTEAIVISGLRPTGFTGNLSTEALVNAARDRCLPAFDHTTVDQRLMASLELDRAHVMRGQRLAWVLTARPAYEVQAQTQESTS